MRKGIQIELPGEKSLDLHALILDFNGTIAFGGVILPQVKEQIEELSEMLDVWVVTADTFGTVAEQLAAWPVRIEKIKTGADKLKILKELGSSKCVAIGNGKNDGDMLAAAALSIGVLGPEGICTSLLRCAQILTREIDEALALLLHPERITATLRS